MSQSMAALRFDFGGTTASAPRVASSALRDLGRLPAGMGDKLRIDEWPRHFAGVYGNCAIPRANRIYTQPLGTAHAVGANGGGCIAMRRSRSGRFAAAGAAPFARAEGERRHDRPANSQPRAARRRP